MPGRDTTGDPRRRIPLSAERIVATATAIADVGGLSKVTMRAVAAELGVEAMSLYHHVPNRDALLDAMVDTVFTEVDAPAPGAPWREAMHERARSTREALKRHPWAVGLLDSRSTPGPATLHHHDAVLGVLRASGFSVAGAVRAFAIIDSYLYGSVLQELNLPFADHEQLEDVAGSIMADFPADAYPHLAEVMTDPHFTAGWDQQTEFESGLGIVIGALQPDAPG